MVLLLYYLNPKKAALVMKCICKDDQKVGIKTKKGAYLTTSTLFNKYYFSSKLS